MVQPVHKSHVSCTNGFPFALRYDGGAAGQLGNAEPENQHGVLAGLRMELTCVDLTCVSGGSLFGAG